MNIYNDDEMMVMFTSEETNMYKYGTNVHMSLSDNYSGKVKTAFNNVHPKGYSKNMKSKVVDLLNRTFNINLSGYTPSIFGFTGTELTDEEMEDYMKISNDYSAGKLHYVFGENDIEKITATWDKVYSMCIENNMSSLVITHAETMFNQYSNELQRIHNIPKDIGKESLSKNIDYVAQTSGINNSGVSGHTPPIIPYDNTVSETINSGSFIDCVEKLAKLYINHVGTYMKTFKTTSEDINSHYSTNRAYEYLTNNGVTIGAYDENKKGFSVEAPTSHGNNIYAESSWMHYVYDENSDGAGMIGNWHVRDDCSGFVKAAIKLAGKEFTGFKTDLINGYDKSLAPNLSLSGYDLYQYSNGVWCKIGFSSLDSSSIIVEPALQEGEVMGLDFLKPGDILVTSGHAEIYVGNNYNKVLDGVEDRNNQKKDYIWNDSDVAHTDTTPGYTNKGTTENPIYVKEGTFSWGNVVDEFPTETKDGNRHYFYYDSGANCFRHCECGNGPDKDDTVHWNNGRTGCNFHRREYTVIWRKK